MDLFYLGWEMAGDMDLEEDDPVGEGEGRGRGLGLGRVSAARTPPSSRDSGRPSSLPSCNNHNWKMLARYYGNCKRWQLNFLLF